MLVRSNRARFIYATIAATTIVFGLLVHYHGTFLSATTRDFSGDALWALTMASTVSATLPMLKPIARYGVALTICYAVEFSQLLHTPALDQFRTTTIGVLTLGSGFDPRDLIAYAVGVTIFAAIDKLFVFNHS